MVKTFNIRLRIASAKLLKCKLVILLSIIFIKPVYNSADFFAISLDKTMTLLRINKFLKAISVNNSVDELANI